jgi:hypothetical protein
MDQEEYEVRNAIKNYVEGKINEGLNIYKELFNDFRYLLLYPLIDIELNLKDDVQESISNFIRRISFI